MKTELEKFENDVDNLLKNNSTTKTDYTNNRQREMGGGLPNPLANTPELDFLRSKQSLYGSNGFNVYGGFGESMICELLKEYASQFKPTPSPSTVDFEREVEELYPDFIVVNKNGTEENLSIPERAAYIKGRQTTSQEGLRELVAILDACKENGFEDISIDFILTKANEILTR